MHYFSRARYAVHGSLPFPSSICAILLLVSTNFSARESRERKRERDVRVKSSNGAISRTVDAEGAFEEKCVHFVKTSRTKKFIFERMDFSNRCDRSVSASVGRVVLSRCKLVHVSYIRMLCYGKRDELRANAYRVS